MQPNEESPQPAEATETPNAALAELEKVKSENAVLRAQIQEERLHVGQLSAALSRVRSGVDDAPTRLLREWLDMPFFEQSTERLQWIHNFEARVRIALGVRSDSGGKS